MVNNFGAAQKTSNKKDCVVFRTKEQARKFIERYIENKRYIRNKEFIEIVNIDLDEVS